MEIYYNDTVECSDKLYADSYYDEGIECDVEIYGVHDCVRSKENGDYRDYIHFNFITEKELTKDEKRNLEADVAEQIEHEMTHDDFYLDFDGWYEDFESYEEDYIDAERS